MMNKLTFINSFIFIYLILSIDSGSCQIPVENGSAPNRMVPSGDFKVYVNGKSLFCYAARVYDTRFTEGVETFKGNYDGSISDWELPFSTVSYAYFDFEGDADVEIHVKGGGFTNAVIRPLRSGIISTVKDSVIHFKISEPASLTIEPGGRETGVLHLFGSRPDINKPGPNDRNVIYFGPGIHEISDISLKSGQTLYIDAGAYVYATEKKRYASNTVIYTDSTENVRIAGRGILDCSRLSTDFNTRKFSLLISRSKNVRVEGIILVGSTIWNLRIFKSENVTVDNVRIISHFFNSDGINTMLSRNVTIKNCFLRQRDDGIVIKSFTPGDIQRQFGIRPDTLSETADVLVENCVIWSDWGYALGASYEIQQPVRHISFRNCDIIHATHATDLQGVIGVLVSDKNTVSDVLFDNITIERSLKPIMKLDIKGTKWTKSTTLGKIREIRFKNITYLGDEVRPVILEGFGTDSNIENVVFENLVCNGKKINSSEDWSFKINQFVKNVSFK